MQGGSVKDFCALWEGEGLQLSDLSACLLSRWAYMNMHSKDPQQGAQALLLAGAQSSIVILLIPLL